MGITGFSYQLIQKAREREQLTSVCELGSQNVYFGEHYGKYGNVIYEGMEYCCIDLNGENNAHKFDLSQPIPDIAKHDLVTDFGTSEHVEDLYQCFKTVHELCAVGGYMIHENPKTGNWPEHGKHYFTEQFYIRLAELMEYELVSLGSHPAMGNEVDGWNVYCILKKTEDKPFIKKSEFKKLPILDK